VVDPKTCHYCAAEIRSDRYEARFRAWGWHLRIVHFPNWGRK
jgi:hypothetical protein